MVLLYPRSVQLGAYYNIIAEIHEDRKTQKRRRRRRDALTSIYIVINTIILHPVVINRTRYARTSVSNTICA